MNFTDEINKIKKSISDLENKYSKKYTINQISEVINKKISFLEQYNRNIYRGAFPDGIENDPLMTKIIENFTAQIFILNELKDKFNKGLDDEL